MYTGLVPPASLAEALQTFWFDVTKSDWRGTMVMGVDDRRCGRGSGCTGSTSSQQFGRIGVAWH